MSGFDADKIAEECMQRYQAIELSLVTMGIDQETAKDLAKYATCHSFK